MHMCVCMCMCVVVRECVCVCVCEGMGRLVIGSIVGRVTVQLGSVNILFSLVLSH